MKSFGITLLMLVVVVAAHSQTYIDPPFEGKATAMVDIEKISITSEHTVVYMKCTTPDEFSFGGWACITRSTYIKDVATNKTYTLLKAKGIPYCPDKYYFTGSGQTIRFKLYFPKLRYDVRHIHIIEDMEQLQNPFNFYNVYLKPLAH